MLNKFVKFFLENRFITVIILILFIGWGLIVSPFDMGVQNLPRDPVHVDAIPNYGENQQIVFTEWPGRSPRDVDDQITYPLTTYLLGMPGVKTIRSNSMFGFSSIYVIFEDDVDFYFSRTRILEKLASIPGDLLPADVQPTLGPDATAMGQIYWYTLQGKDSNGNITGGWNLEELRTIQDYYVKYALSAVDGVSEVASIGGHVKEYHVDVDPAAMERYNVNFSQIVKAVKNSNLDVGARTLEMNRVEYFVRGVGYIKSLEDLRKAVVVSHDQAPVTLEQVAHIGYGPAERRGILDKDGAEVVGGVVVARYGANPMEVINNVKAKIGEISAGLPTKELDDGTTSKIEIVPFYDRTQLIYETLGTLEEALTLEIIITIIVIVIMVLNLRASLLISGLIPVAVLMTFIAMRYFNVDANIVALSGIAIAIGTIVDVGIVLAENMLRHTRAARKKGNFNLDTIFEAVKEVAPAVTTAVLTTIVSFIPVFAMEGAEGKLFHPLAFTKTFVLVAALFIALVFLPAIGYWLFRMNIRMKLLRAALNFLLIPAGIYVMGSWHWLPGFFIMLIGLTNVTIQFFEGVFRTDGSEVQSKLHHTVEELVASFIPKGLQNAFSKPENTERIRTLTNSILTALIIAFWLTWEWLPMTPAAGNSINYLFVLIVIGLLLGAFLLFIRYYAAILRRILKRPFLFLTVPVVFVLFGLVVWQGWNGAFGFVARGFDKMDINIRTTNVWSSLHHTFPGTGKEFMPALDEGAFLLMPTSMPHAGMGENKRVLRQLDMAVSEIPEVTEVVGKAGRVESSLDPAPMSMYENVIQYKTEYKTNAKGERIRFAVDDNGNFFRDSAGNLIPDPTGRYFRQWRDHIQSADDIWQEIVDRTKLPGVTSAPKLQPIETRLVMLQTGMRAPMGIRISGTDLQAIQDFGVKLEHILKKVPQIKPASIFAERIVGKPYLEIMPDRDKLARYGLKVADVQQFITAGIGGMPLTRTVEGRERYNIRVRYARELRDNPEKIRQMLVPVPAGGNIPLDLVADVRYRKGPQMIKSENAFPVGYVIFDRKSGVAETDAVMAAKDYLQTAIDQGTLEVPSGINFEFAGNYENQVRAEKRLSLLIPLVLLIIAVILYMQFRKVSVMLMVFSGIAVAFSGGFILIWLYGQDWFMNFAMFGNNLRDVFSIETVYLSVAVWVGFIALFGIATDDGVIMASYLEQVFEKNKPQNKQQIVQSVIEAGSRRVRPCLMTTATTLLALLPVLSSTGRGSDVMVPMAIPAFGGMLIELITLFVIPVLYALHYQRKMKKEVR